ncbi:hypothetical protein GH714_040568 [Hevea brasiliensis]|uniref:Legume lectin domain-containing protein n=1 Tax=Hevea brasiliensis TaxID=3981 RepID=A0A6A6L576_HEVBR|nr:hypothetical protein GH714_040568 [Hevea brasiliensis]
MTSLKSQNSRLSLLKIHILNLYIIILSLPITPNASASSLNFKFTSFSSSDPKIFTEEDANVTNGEIELTSMQPGKETGAKFGRATYAEPLHLFDKASGSLTNFTTYFSFVIDSRGFPKYGDGITFFLAPNGSRMPPNVTGGGGIGLVRSNSRAINPKVNKFFAVEFDTYHNDWDPPYDHIGFNVNSMISIVNRTWRSGATTGNKTVVRITYDSSQKVLKVKFSFIDRDNKTIKNGYMSAEIDLAVYLPEWVTFGFSSSTGNPGQGNRITSWEFISSSRIVENGDRSPPPWADVGFPNAEGPSDPVVRQQRRDKIGLVTGLIVGACALIVLVEMVKLGEGGFGAVYKGFLKDLNYFIAVKRVSKVSEQDGQMKIVEWVWKLYGMGKLLEAADPKLCRDFDEQQMERLMIIGLWCAHPDAVFRPSIWEVANVLLNFEALLPNLPSEMPPLAYLASPKLSATFSHTSPDVSATGNGQQTT